MGTTCQSYYTLKNPGDNIDKTHELYTLHYLFEIFKELNPSLFEENKNPGRPRIYTANIMLPFILWGHLNKIISCRDLENWWTRNDDTCNFILNCKKPGKSSINEFLNDYNYLIDAFDMFIVEFSLKIGLMNGNIIYHDGTILKGYCNNFKKLYADQLYYLRDFILKYRYETDEDGLWFKMDKYFNNNEFKEEIEPILKKLKEKIYAGGLYLLESIFKQKNGLKKILLKIKHMEENVKGNQPISITDPEAHSMLNKDKKWGFNYNLQSGVDDKYGMIAVHYITQSPNDKKELLITVKELNERLGREDYVIVVDYGYWHIKSLKEIHNSPTTIVIPDRTAASRKKEKSNKKQKNKQNKKKKSRKIDEEYEKPKFFKDWQKDIYICPNGSILTRMNNNTQNSIEYKVYGTDDCFTCPDHDKCATESKRKLKDRCESEINEIKNIYYSKWGQKIYSGRGYHAEGNFATLRESRNFRGIKTRGTKRVNDELTRYTITHNIKKIHKHTTVNILKTILNLIKQEKTKHRNVDINIIDELIENFIITDEIIVDLKIK
jgi:hypothetical protein